ncbi:MAG: hypothetical protein AAFN13_13825 [Bacteroidota bacterium]
MSDRRLLRLAVWCNLIAAACSLGIALLDYSDGRQNLPALALAVLFGGFGLFLRRLAQQAS